MLKVNDKEFSVTLSMYFGVMWTEDRLVARRDEFNPDWLPINMEFMDSLWVPNVFIYELVSFKALECLKKLAGLWFIKDKELFYNQVRLGNALIRDITKANILCSFCWGCAPRCKL